MMKMSVQTITVDDINDATVMRVILKLLKHINEGIDEINEHLDSAESSVADFNVRLDNLVKFSEDGGLIITTKTTSETVSISED